MTYVYILSLSYKSPVFVQKSQTTFTFALPLNMNNIEILSHLFVAIYVQVVSRLGDS